MSEQNTQAPQETFSEQAEATVEAADQGTESEQQEGEQASSSSSESATPQEAASSAEKKIESLKRKLKLKVDGKEFEEEFDLGNEAELIKHLQLSKVSQKRMQEAAEYQKRLSKYEEDMSAVIEMLKKDPERVLSDPSVGVDTVKLAEKILQRQLEEAEKSPEQKEREKIQRELEKAKKELEAEREAKRSAEMARIEEQEAKNLDEEITEALESSGLPKKPYYVKRIADYLLLGLQKGKRVTAKDVISLVKQEALNDIRELASAAPDEGLEELFGKDFFDRIRKRNMKRQKQVPDSTRKIEETAKKVVEDDGEKKKTIKLNNWLRS